MNAPAPGSSCPKCGAPRVGGLVCPRCGIIYAKAEARAARPPTKPAPVEPEAPASVPIAAAGAVAATVAVLRPEAPVVVAAEAHPFWELDPEDAEREWKIRAVAVPAALLLARLLMETGAGKSLGRIFFSMWLHEFGHTLVSWFTGFQAFPLPWLTHTWEDRSVLMALMVAAWLGGIGYWGWRRGWTKLTAVAGGLLLVQAIGTLAVSVPKAQEWIVFGGDAGCFVLGTLCMASFLVPAARHGKLRWGFLAIGAMGFMDPFEQWWASRHDTERLPFGENEGVTLSDMSKLADVHHWPIPSIIDRFVGLGIACLVLLALAWAWAVWDARRQARAA